MLKKFMFLALVLVFLFSFPISSLARVYYQSIAIAPVATPTPTPTSTPIPVVDSFAIFWPMVAGKTMQSKIYFLKTLKEEIRSFFIFGKAEKADYRMFLVIKRMLEAEDLIKNNIPNLANKTLDSAISNLDKASSSLNSAKSSGKINKSTIDEINIRISNLKKFNLYLIGKYPSYKNKLQNILDKLNTL